MVETHGPSLFRAAVKVLAPADDARRIPNSMMAKIANGLWSFSRELSRGLSPGSDCYLFLGSWAIVVDLTGIVARLITGIDGSETMCAIGRVSALQCRSTSEVFRED